MSTTLSSAATCDLRVVTSARRKRTVSTRAEMESVCCFSSFPRITPKGTIPNFVWYAGTEIFSAFSLYNMYSWAQSVEGVGGGGEEVIVLGRFGVAERVIGVEVEPVLKGTG